MVDLVNDYFVVKFNLEEDLHFVLTGGPWIVADRCRPVFGDAEMGFCPTSATITRMVAWIHVSAIQLECFGICALKKIVNLLSKLLKIDALTIAQHRGKFTRLCVKLDLSKPLKAFV